MIGGDNKNVSPKVIRREDRVDQGQGERGNTDDQNITITAPQWVDEALKELAPKLAGAQFEIDGQMVSLSNPPTLRELSAIARNESGNVTGIIRYDLYQGIEPEVIVAIRDLVKHTVITGKAEINRIGGYPPKYEYDAQGNPIVENGNYKMIIPPKLEQNIPVYVCDLPGMQFQCQDNTGRHVLISKPGENLVQGALDNLIFQRTVGEPKATFEQAEKDQNRYIPGYFRNLVGFDKENKPQYTYQEICFDTKAYQSFVANDFVLAAMALNKQAKANNDEINYKFLKYGAGFFADGVYNKDGKALDVSENLIKGVLVGLNQLAQLSPEERSQIKRIELPFYQSDNENVINTLNLIEKRCKELGIEFASTFDDALKPTSKYITATTTCSDPHAPPGNEMRYGSVDAAIAENIEGKLNNFNAALNNSMKMEYKNVKKMDLGLNQPSATQQIAASQQVTANQVKLQEARQALPMHQFNLLSKYTPPGKDPIYHVLENAKIPMNQITYRAGENYYYLDGSKSAIAAINEKIKALEVEEERRKEAATPHPLGEKTSIPLSDMRLLSNKETPIQDVQNILVKAGIHPSEIMVFSRNPSIPLYPVNASSRAIEAIRKEIAARKLSIAQTMPPQATQPQTTQPLTQPPIIQPKVATPSLSQPFETQKISKAEMELLVKGNLNQNALSDAQMQIIHTVLKNAGVPLNEIGFKPRFIQESFYLQGTPGALIAIRNEIDAIKLKAQQQNQQPVAKQVVTLDRNTINNLFRDAIKKRDGAQFSGIEQVQVANMLNYTLGNGIPRVDRTSEGGYRVALTAEELKKLQGISNSVEEERKNEATPMQQQPAPQTKPHLSELIPPQQFKPTEEKTDRIENQQQTQQEVAEPEKKKKKGKKSKAKSAASAVKRFIDKKVEGIQSAISSKPKQPEEKKTYPPLTVEELGKIAAERFKSGEMKVTQWAASTTLLVGEEWKLAHAQGGRTPKWVEKTFGMPENEIIERLKEQPAPQTRTVEEIQKALERDRSVKAATTDLPKFTLVEGVGVNDLHHTALGQNCVLQVASQFNFQESPSSQDMPVSSYLNDRTQGPQASIEAAAAALMRKAAYEAGNLPDALSSVLPRAMFETPPLNKYFQLYENGYLNLGSKRDIIGSKPPRAEYVSEADKKLILAAIQQNLKKLLVLPQEVTCEASGAKQLQVFCAAPQLAGGDAKDPINKAICKELVVAQYVAVAQLAVIESRKKGITIPLHLTLVGQGAFENDPSIMKHAMEAVANVVKGENVAVYVHAYKNADKKLFVDQTKDSTEFLKVETMSREDFKNQLQAPQLHTPSNFLQHLSILAKNNDLQGIDKLLKISHFHQNVPNGEAMWIPPRSEHRAINNILATVLAGNNIQMQSDPNNKFNQAICCKGVRLDDANPEQKAMKDLYRQIQQFKADTTNVKDQKVEANATYNHHQEDMVLHGFHEALKKHDDHTNKEQHKDYLQKNQQEVQKQKQKLGS